MTTTDTAPIITAALNSMNDGDYEGLCSLFTPDGTVTHEDRPHHGRSEIAAWFSRIPPVLIHPITAFRRGTEHVVDAEVDGVSPDGPQSHRFTFVLAEHEIRSMSVNVLR
ncbi:nuclear transport factor 2 family protein [Labedella phragmitis]|uniref:Nuclear transport factor 2 family protein n=1 Tax=Labedella phragmitis TaxID=2498849 RepID=A0A3S3ZSA1_9MICO|nr:nuclear transport factor 2 family protein [Labedella phragmitis]RWZ52544.1 nuclear transport factor 2 family protein [Labedella phragmitis]